MSEKRKVTYYLPEDLVRGTRVLAARSDRRDSDVVADALRAHLGWDVLDEVWAVSGLSEEEAVELAVAETRAVRSRKPGSRSARASRSA